MRALLAFSIPAGTASRAILIDDSGECKDGSCHTQHAYTRPMCRLFALHAGDRDVATDFWLLNAPDSIAHQSEINADGYGLAALTAKQGMIIVRNPVKAATDNAYQQLAQRLVAAEMVVHLRYADTGE